MRQPEYVLLHARVMGSNGLQCSNRIGAGEGGVRAVARKPLGVGVANRMNGSREDRQRVGRVGRPRKFLPFVGRVSVQV